MLTIEEMKKALMEKGVALPGARAKKDEYIRLYDEHISLNNSVGDHYSSDEDTQNSTKVSSTNKLDILNETVESPKKMTNDELFQKLSEAGIALGPVVDNTRAIYEKRYLQYLRGEISATPKNGTSVAYDQLEISDNEIEISNSQSHISMQNHNGDRDSPRPSTSTSETKLFDSTKTKRISYIEKIHRGSSERVIEPITGDDMYVGRTGQADQYVGKWSPKIRTPSPLLQKESSAKPWRSVVFVLGAIFLFVVLVIVYHQWTTNDPYKAIEDDAEQFAARKTEM